MNWLGYSEDGAWKLTPRKWAALIEVHLDIISKQNGTGQDSTGTGATQQGLSDGFIDQVKGWD